VKWGKLAKGSKLRKIESIQQMSVFSSSRQISRASEPPARRKMVSRGLNQLAEPKKQVAAPKEDRRSEESSSISGQLSDEEQPEKAGACAIDLDDLLNEQSQFTPRMFRNSSPNLKAEKASKRAKERQEDDNEGSFRGVTVKRVQARKMSKEFRLT
jgi:hypothetical protein